MLPKFGKATPMRAGSFRTSSCLIRYLEILISQIQGSVFVANSIWKVSPEDEAFSTGIS